MPDGINNPSSADVVGGKIVLRTPFFHLFRCRSIPGGWWDASRRAWLYPAIARHAHLISSLIPQLQASEQFAALLGRNGRALKPLVKLLEPEVVLPAGLKTKPWRHQVEAYQFALERLTRGAPSRRWT